MANWKPLTLGGVERAICIYVSKGHDYLDIKNSEFLKDKHGEHWIDQWSAQVIKELQGGEECELIFNVKGAYRARMYWIPENDIQRIEQFPGVNYLIGITPMEHYNASKEEVDARFLRMKEALLSEGFPTVNF